MILEKANIEFSSLPVRELILDKTLKSLIEKYDICMIDTSPSLSLLTTNAISCADSVYIPVKAGFFEMKGSKLLIDLINELKNDINQKLEIKGIFITQYDARTNISQAVIDAIDKNMPNKLMDLNEKILLRKRNIIETVFDYLKNKMNLEHTRHRSPINAFVHILSTFISYCFKKNKPSINYGFDLSLNYALIPN